MALQRYATRETSPAAVPPIVHEVLPSVGQPLDAQTRAFFEPRLGHDFSHVRVHADATAKRWTEAVQAAAYTVGSHIIFAPDRYDSASPAGRQLIAELAHVVQARGSGERTAHLRVAPPDSAAEVEADRWSRKADRTAEMEHTRIGVVSLPGFLHRQAATAPSPTGPAPPIPSPSALAQQACFEGHTVHVNKNGRSIACPAVTSSSDPTPIGQFCVRKQGEAQLPWHWYRFWRADRSSWFLLEPQFPTTRFRMDLHPGSVSKGCVTVRDSDCFQKMAAILSSGGTTVGYGYDGYPPGNSEGVSNVRKDVECVAMLDVNYKEGACGSP
jgi:hypothetical protein